MPQRRVIHYGACKNTQWALRLKRVPAKVVAASVRLPASLPAKLPALLPIRSAKRTRKPILRSAGGSAAGYIYDIRDCLRNLFFIMEEKH